MQCRRKERRNILGNNVTPEDLARLLEGVVVRGHAESNWRIFGAFLNPWEGRHLGTWDWVEAVVIGNKSLTRALSLSCGLCVVGHC